MVLGATVDEIGALLFTHKSFGRELLKPGLENVQSFWIELAVEIKESLLIDYDYASLLAGKYFTVFKTELGNRFRVVIVRNFLTGFEADYFDFIPSTFERPSNEKPHRINRHIAIQLDIDFPLNLVPLTNTICKRQIQQFALCQPRV